VTDEPELMPTDDTSVRICSCRDNELCGDCSHLRGPIPGAKIAEFMTVRGGIGNDAFAATQNLVNVARAMFANEGIDLKTVEAFRCRVTRNHDADDIGGYPIAMWDTWVEVEYPAPADDTKEDE
jgi:hypothetical protein